MSCFYPSAAMSGNGRTMTVLPPPLEYAMPLEQASCGKKVAGMDCFSGGGDGNFNAGKPLLTPCAGPSCAVPNRGEEQPSDCSLPEFQLLTPSCRISATACEEFDCDGDGC